MIDERERFDRAVGLFEMPEPAFDRLLGRRERRGRTQRRTAAAIAIAVVAATSIFLTRSFRDDVPSPGPAGTHDVRRHDGIGLEYTVPRGWTIDRSGPHDLILDAGGERRLIVSTEVWAGPAGCVVPEADGSGPRCRTGASGIVAWLRSTDALDVSTGIRPIGVDGFDTFRLEVEVPAGARERRPVLHRTTEDGRDEVVVSVRPAMRVGLYLVVADRGLLVVSVLAPGGEFSAFSASAEDVIASFDLRS